MHRQTLAMGLVVTVNYLLLCGDQLFSVQQLTRDFGRPEDIEVLMVEDPELCERRPYHQQKLTLVLASMRHHAELLKAAGYHVRYSPLTANRTLSQVLTGLPKPTSFDLSGELHGYAAHSVGQQRWIERACRAAGYSWSPRQTPMFMTPLDEFPTLAGTRKPLQMARFYKNQRKRLGVLLEDNGEPTGGRWSFDEDNRRKLPKQQAVPALPHTRVSAMTAEVADMIARHYPDNIGTASDLWLPTDRAGALEWLEQFLNTRLIGFGTFEDAISQRSWSLFHSALSPLINLGLVTPQEVLDKTLLFAQQNVVPINDLEGFVRQLIGWREFIFGVYVTEGDAMRQTNSRAQHRRMLPTWLSGELDIPPFDDAIATLKRTGWNHHIERLMIIANLMNLAQIEPVEVFEFFMTNYLDAYDWVMVPNVYGMGLNSDNNTFATKPYICGSNYWLKMSDYQKGPWCDVVDGLYWQFVDRHRDLLAKNPRTAMMIANLNRLKPERKQIIFSAADRFIVQHTKAAARQ